MKFLKWVILCFCILTIVFTPIGLFTDLFFAKLIGAISLFFVGVLTIVRLVLEKRRKKNSEIHKEKNKIISSNGQGDVKGTEVLTSKNKWGRSNLLPSPFFIYIG